MSHKEGGKFQQFKDQDEDVQVTAHLSKDEAVPHHHPSVVITPVSCTHKM
jgi:hypothetical protein